MNLPAPQAAEGQPALRVLAVEDDPNDAALLLRELQRSGQPVSVDVVETREAMLDRLRTGGYDVVICDYHLRGWNGRDALLTLKEISSPHPFILLTGSMVEQKAAECIQLGADDFVLKRNLAHLPVAIRRVLQVKKLEQQRIASEAALQESEDRFRRLVEISPEAIFVGCQGVVVFINPAGVKLFGARDASELVGKTVDDLVHPDFHQVVYQKIQQHEGGDAAVPAEEERFRRLDGTFVDVEVSAIPFQWKGRASLQVMARDITQRKRAEEALRTSEAKFRSLVENAPYAIYKTNLDTGRFISVNPAMVGMLGYESEAEVLALDLGQQVYRDPAARVRLLPELQRQEHFQNLELDWKRKDGTTLLLRSSGRMMQDGTGERFFEAFAEDITGRTQAEASLRESEARLRLSVQAAHIGLWDWDLQTNEVYYSPEWKGQLGYADHEISNRFAEWERLLHPDDLESARQKVAAFLAAPHGKYEAEFRLHHKDGSYRWIYTQADALRDAGGKPLRVLGCHMDITERKRSEAERARLAAAIEQSDEVVLIAGLKGEVEFVNPAFTRVSGYSREEIQGRNPRLLKSGKHDQTFYKRLWDTILAGEIWRGEFINRKKDGSLYTQRTTITPVHDATGKLTNFIEISEDITQRKRDEEALRRSEEDFRSLVINAPYGICRANQDGSRLTAVNPAVVKMLGYSSEEEVLALNLATDLLSSPTELARVVEMVSQQEGFQHLETVWKRKDGKMITVHGSGRAVRDGAGVLRFEWIVEDVTATREMEQQLRQAQKMEAVGRLAGGIAHDFNNLLTVIRGYAELMLGETDLEKVRTRAQNIMKASDRTAGLTRQLLAFSRKQVLWPQVLDLNAVMAEIQKMLPSLLGEDVRVVVIPGPKLGRVKVDPSQLEQVLMNLAINARDAMTKGGKLVLETANVECDEAYCALHPGAQPGSYVMLAVSDSGCGMDAETQAHIFEPFFTTKPKDKGTGLGLATVYGIVKQSGGHIWVYSEPSVGTTFKVYLPRVEKKGAAVPLPPRPAEKAEGTETILLVEDQEDLRALALEFLEQRGYRVLQARNGAEALEVAAGHVDPIHLLVTDIVMPGMRGRELAEKLCSSRPQMKVLFVSGYTDGSILQNGELGLGSAFLEKPFTSDSLARKVRQVLNSVTSGCESPAGPKAVAPAKKSAKSPAARLESK
jgi:PAS domain S-box-containing protein